MQKENEFQKNLMEAKKAFLNQVETGNIQCYDCDGPYWGDEEGFAPGWIFVTAHTTGAVTIQEGYTPDADTCDYGVALTDEGLSAVYELNYQLYCLNDLNRGYAKMKKEAVTRWVQNVLNHVAIIEFDLFKLCRVKFDFTQGLPSYMYMCNLNDDEKKQYIIDRKESIRENNVKYYLPVEFERA